MEEKKGERERRKNREIVEFSFNWTLFEKKKKKKKNWKAAVPSGKKKIFAKMEEDIKCWETNNSRDKI